MPYSHSRTRRGNTRRMAAANRSVLATRAVQGEDHRRAVQGQAGQDEVPRDAARRSARAAALLREHPACRRDDIRELAEYLGHHDPGYTLRVYEHLLPDSHERARKAIDDRFFRPRAVADGT